MPTPASCVLVPFILLVALPLNSPRVECILDARSRVGVAGDWVMGSSMEAAAVSGVALAQRLAALRGVPVPQQEGSSHDLGLRDAFFALSGDSSSHEIGGFPGLEVAGHGKPQRPPQQQWRQQQRQPQQQLGRDPVALSPRGQGGQYRGKPPPRDRQDAPLGRQARPAPQMLPLTK